MQPPHLAAVSSESSHHFSSTSACARPDPLNAPLALTAASNQSIDVSHKYDIPSLSSRSPNDVPQHHPQHPHLAHAPGALEHQPHNPSTLSENTESNTPDCDIARAATKQENGEDAYTCGLVCSKVFKSTDELTRHFLHDHVENYTSALKTTVGLDNQENKPDLSKFSGNLLMSNLLAMATGAPVKATKVDSRRLSGKTYDCDICTKKFGRLADLSRHLLVHSGVKPYRCQICEKSYRNSGDLKTHMNMHAGIRPFGCPVCQRSFTARGVLARHLRTHTGEKPYACFVCAKAFADRRSRHDHILTHTGEKPHNCSLCGKNFLQSSTLRTHLKTQHSSTLAAVKTEMASPNHQGSVLTTATPHLPSPQLPSPQLPSQLAAAAAAHHAKHILNSDISNSTSAQNLSSANPTITVTV